MATAPQPGGRNDLFALKEARRFHDAAAAKVDSAVREVEQMRQSVGRPDYGRLNLTLGQLALDLAKQSKWLEEMWVMRQTSVQSTDAQLEDRIAYMEAQIDALNLKLEIMQREPLYPTE